VAKKTINKTKTKEKEKPKPKPEKKAKGKKKEKPAKKVIVVEEPAKRVDIDTTMYHNLFKFLDEKVSVECFIGLHDHCFGQAVCECECHANK
jgi:hypothetical protein